MRCYLARPRVGRRSALVASGRLSGYVKWLGGSPFFFGLMLILQLIWSRFWNYWGHSPGSMCLKPSHPFDNLSAEIYPLLCEIRREKACDWVDGQNEFSVLFPCYSESPSTFGRPEPRNRGACGSRTHFQAEQASCITTDDTS